MQTLEVIEFTYPAKSKITRQAHVGIVGSGSLEVLMESSNTDSASVRIRTTVAGYQDTWKAVLDRFFSNFDGAVRIEINDAGATPGNVLLRLQQAVELVKQ